MKAASAEAISQAATAEEEDSAPLDFDTFVPSYDPSLPVPSEAPAAPESSFFIPAPSTTMVSRDEAFSRALSAMYWGGYWTAVYHVSPFCELVAGYYLRINLLAVPKSAALSGGCRGARSSGIRR